MQNTETILQTPPRETDEPAGGTNEIPACKMTEEAPPAADAAGTAMPRETDAASDGADAPRGPEDGAPADDASTGEPMGAGPSLAWEAADAPCDAGRDAEAPAGDASSNAGRDAETPAGDASAGDAPPDSRHNVALGERGEDAAARFLERRGLQILERNWKCVAGEADIIARDEDAVHFVEVKTRSNVDCGFPSEAVDRGKRERYERIAVAYLADYDVVDIGIMFDIISIVVTGPNRAVLRYHRNAFCGCE